MPRLFTVWLISLLTWTVSSLHAFTIHVPEDAPNIQAGIDGAADGDTVLVAGGYYTGLGNRDLDFTGKAIVVTSEDGPEATIIDCEGSALEPHRGLYFHNGEGLASVVKGFTIWGGYASMDSPQGSGGAILCEDSSPTIEGNHIIGNWSEVNGGGIYAGLNSFPAVIDNLIAGNAAENTGGGIWCAHSDIVIAGNRITGNEGTWAGGGIFIDYASPSITRTVLSHNSSFWGGGLFCWDSAPVLENCTISLNRSSTTGGGIYGIYGAAPSIHNSIVWGDVPDEIFMDFGSPVVTYSDIEGGWSGIGNIDADPSFVLPEWRDFRLLWESPCIDAGDPLLSDPDGTRSDIGAHPFNQDDFITLYLSPDTTIVNPGDALTVTYTLINRWQQTERFGLLTRAVMPNGATREIVGPARYTLPAGSTERFDEVHPVPAILPSGKYSYWTQIGLPPSTLHDEEIFSVSVR